MSTGHKFLVDLDSDDEHPSPGNAVSHNPTLSASVMGDIQERKPIAPKPPVAPSMKTSSGFPEHQKRSKTSRFKQNRPVASPPALSHDSTHLSPRPASPTTTPRADDGAAPTWEEEERRRIDLENREKLASMSPDEIEQERRELIDSLSPGLLQRLLQRATIDSGSSEVELSPASRSTAPPTDPKSSNVKSVSFVEPDSNESLAQPSSSPHETPTDSLPTDTVHFPRPPQPPDLDPNSPTFLSDLHEKYFPSLPSDPAKLAWMQPTTSPSSYSPTQTSLSPPSLRFSFTGALLPPRTAHSIPVTAGLHHHSDAPDAAGYTIPELALFCRSAFPAQRCIGFATLGRLLFRLGKGEFGDGKRVRRDSQGVEEGRVFGRLPASTNAGDNDSAAPEQGSDTNNNNHEQEEDEIEDEEDGEGMSSLARSLWSLIEREGILDLLVRESEGRGVDGGRHVSARAYATEALWLWRQGGGRRWKAD